MSEAWKSGTRVISPTAGRPAVTLVIDDAAEAKELFAEALAELDLSNIELRASFAGPSRGAAEVLPDILVVVQQLGVGAAGSGIWFAVQVAIGRIVRWRQGKRPELTTAEQTVTIMIPTDQGPALLQRVTIGVDDLNAERASFEALVRSMIDSAGHRS
ncbi:hypothetical protein [Micromonospora sp. HK10]|uniref:hypothetical protein n=1 Tax=Micromonospora sp. HK10 TaxID=1538294 RepID=UPI0012E1AEA2|nr:hypothetical protein [Micromonospora sp. HK10]